MTPHTFYNISMHMSEKHRAQLEKAGLSSGEAQIYLALLRTGTPMTASAIVAATGVPRGSVYPTLTRLTDMGLVEAEAGYGGRFSAVPAESALPSLIVREREELSQREQILNQLTKELKSVAEPAALDGEAEFIQVLRDPRVVGERFERLQREAARQVDVFIKFPLLDPQRSNPVQEEAMQRGVRYRGLYERAILDVPEIKPYLIRWVAAGEEARVHEGELPHKLAIFDRQNILMPLVTPRGQGKTLLIRHPQLATSLGILFDFFWGQATPVHAAVTKLATASQNQMIRKTAQRLGSNHHRRRSIRKPGSA